MKEQDDSRGPSDRFLCYGIELWSSNAVINVGYHSWTKKVKVTLVQALRLCTGRTAHRGSRGIALLLHDHGTKRGWGVSVTPRQLFTTGKDPVPIVQEAGWASRPVWTGAENLAPTGIRSPDRPARSQLLYWLCYPAHTLPQGAEISTMKEQDDSRGPSDRFLCYGIELWSSNAVADVANHSWTDQA
jgi:hypothetical protein